MRFIISYLLLFITCSFYQAQCTQKATLPSNHGVYGPAFFIIDNLAYFTLSWAWGGEDCHSLWTYNSVTDQWNKKANFPGEKRDGASGFSIDYKGFVLGGSVSGCCPKFFNDFWEYNAFTDTWTQKQNFPGSGSDFDISFSIGYRGFFGRGGSNFWSYNSITDQWIQLSNVPGEKRKMTIAFVINGKAYVGLGYKAEYPYEKLNDMYMYDPSTDIWTKLSPAPLSGYVSAFAINGKGYINSYESFWQFEPNNDSWTQLDKCLTNEVSCPTGFSIGNKGYLAFGSTGNWICKNELFEFDPRELEISLDEKTKSRKLSIYPNPSKDFLTIETERPIAYAIFNLMGQQVISDKIASDKNQISLEALPNGIYFLKIDEGRNSVTKKLIKH
jgi:N-acetylneuraminic acid mutarotase